MKDLFGNDTTPTQYKHPGAYPAPPGSGPACVTCRECVNYRSVGGGSRSYPKCDLMRKHWTGGPGTDIKASSPACRMFEINRKG